MEVARRAGVSRPTVWRWQQRYGEDDVDDLLRTRRARRAGRPCGGDGGQGVGPDLHRAAGRGHSLERLCHGQGGRHLASCRPAHLGNPRSPAAPRAHLQALQRSRLAEKVEDIVRLYMDPPTHAIVLSIAPQGAGLAWPSSPLGLPLTPTSASWLDAVETFFSALSRRRLKRGAFCSITDLQTAINRYIREHNNEPNPFVWTKPADAILAKTSRIPARAVLGGNHTGSQTPALDQRLKRLDLELPHSWKRERDDRMGAG
jgi:hypothetical protein